MFSLPAFYRSKAWMAPVSILGVFLLFFIACSVPESPELLEPGSDQLDMRANNGNQILAEEDVFPLNGLTVDEHGNPIVPIAADPGTPIYYLRTGLPILAPDGHHVTAGEYAAVTGTIKAKCIGPGTQVTIHLSNLIPNATYRFWILNFKEPGFNIMWPNPFVNVIGGGALGPHDRSRNTIKASASGEGTIVRFIPEGLFSEFGYAEACQLTDVFEWHVVGAFQQPGQPHGPNVGLPVLFPYSAVEQFGVIFK